MMLVQLEYFAKIAKLGHLTQAVSMLMIALPSLTQSIRKLEQKMGFTLFGKRAGESC